MSRPRPAARLPRPRSGRSSSSWSPPRTRARRSPTRAFHKFLPSRVLWWRGARSQNTGNPCRFRPSTRGSPCKSLEETRMNLNVSGHHVEVTPAIRTYVRSKLLRVTRHFDHVIDAHVILTGEKLRQKAEVTLHIPRTALHCESDAHHLSTPITLPAHNPNPPP